jgi:integrase/recombinase XerD
LTLAVVRDLRDARAVAGLDELEAFETDVLAGFVLARAAAGCPVSFELRQSR